MIANVDKVLDWLSDNSLEFWTVYTKDSDNAKVFETADDETLEDKKARFRKVMEYCTGSRFIIKAKVVKGSGRGIFTEEFKNLPDGSISQNATISGVPQNIGVGYVSIDELEKRLRDREERILERVKYQRIEEENKDLKDELNAQNTTLNNVLKRAEPYVGTILGNIAGRFIPAPVAVGVAGMEDVTVTVDDQERLERALARYSAVEPDFIRIIEKLAEMCENKDQMYTIAKNTLIK